MLNAFQLQVFRMHPKYNLMCNKQKEPGLHEQAQKAHSVWSVTDYDLTWLQKS